MLEACFAASQHHTVVGDDDEIDVVLMNGTEIPDRPKLEGFS